MFSEASVGHSVRGVYDVTSCLDAWLHILSCGVVLRMMMCVWSLGNPVVATAAVGTHPTGIRSC